jgi:hypothetical protein
VLIRRAPPTRGAAHNGSITANGEIYTWSFTVSPTALRADNAGRVLIQKK